MEVNVKRGNKTALNSAIRIVTGAAASLLTNEKGEVDTAKGYFDSSLDLAEKENKKRAVEEKIKVAEFNSENQDYDSEIELRKQALKDIEKN